MKEECLISFSTARLAAATSTCVGMGRKAVL